MATFHIADGFSSNHIRGCSSLLEANRESAMPSLTSTSKESTPHVGCKEGIYGQIPPLIDATTDELVSGLERGNFTSVHLVNASSQLPLVTGIMLTGHRTILTGSTG